MQCKTVMLLKAASILWYLVVLSLVEIVVRVKYIHRWTTDKNCINLPVDVMSNNMRFLFHKVLIIIMTTTTTTSPTPRPTLSLRSEAFLRNRDASDRKRSLEVFSLSDLATINLEIGWRLFFMFLQKQNLSWSSERLFPLLRTAPILPLITPVTFNKIITAKDNDRFRPTSSTWLRRPASRSPTRGPAPRKAF